MGIFGLPYYGKNRWKPDFSSGRSKWSRFKKGLDYGLDAVEQITSGKPNWERVYGDVKGIYGSTRGRSTPLGRSKGGGRGRGQARPRKRLPSGGPGPVRPPPRKRPRYNPRRGTYLTNGIVGRAFGRARMGMRKRGGYNFSKGGVMRRVESHTVIEQDKVVYVGHAAAGTKYVFDMIFESLVRKLAQIAGHHIKSMDAKVYEENLATHASANYVIMQWVAGDEGAIRKVTYNVPVNATWSTMADGVKLAWLVDFQTAHTAAFFERFRLIEIQWAFNPSTTNAVNLAKFPLSSTYLSMETSSQLTLQNRTLANSGANPEHHDSMLDVENNPLEGYKYATVGNGFVLKWTNDFTAPSVPFIANATTAVLTGDPDNASFTAQEQSMLSQPPAKHTFQRCYRSAKVALLPGQLRRNYLSYAKTFHINELLRKMKAYLLTPSAANRVFFGKCEMFAFEKSMHTNDANEPNMSIGVECNVFYKMKCWYKTPRILVQNEGPVPIA